MDLKEALNYIFNGQSMLFTGSGFSLGAKNLIGNVPRAGELVTCLDRETGYDSGGDLGYAAEEYIRQKGEYQMVGLLKSLFTVKEITKAQEAISKQRWLRIYTTNYDQIVEIGGRKNSLARHSVTLSDQVNDYKDLKNEVIHLNGCIDNLTVDKLNDEFKLTNVSYLTRDFQNSEWLDLFQFDLKDARAIFFVGFSMRYDLDIKRLIAMEAYKDKCFFIISPKESDKNKRQLDQFGTVLPIGTEGFADVLDKAYAGFTPALTKIPPIYLCFKEYSPRHSRPKIKDKDVSNLFLRGEIDDSMIDYSIHEPSTYLYYINRSQLSRAMTLIENGCKRIVINSDLGNGKSLFIKGLGILLSGSGYKVYEFKREEISVSREIDEICSIKDKKVAIILENYSSYKNVLKDLKLRCTDQVLIFTERSVKNDMAIDALSLQFGKPAEIDLNVLCDDEIRQLIAIMDKYGLWGKSAARRNDQKYDTIKNYYHGSLSSVLLDIISSPNIIGKYQSEISKIKKGAILYEALILILINRYFELNLDLEMLSVAIDDDLLNNYTLRRDPIIKQFIDFSNLEINVRSSVFSEAILKNVIDPVAIGRVLIKAFKRINIHRGEPKYKRILFSFLSSSNLIRLLDRKGENNQSILIDFFEQIRDCEFCRNNPHYWLQYAIVKLREPDYDMANMFFKNAYSFASKKPDFDTYQIDNHYARYLMENSTRNIDDKNFMKTVSRVQDILTEPSHLKDTKYYPFRVAQNYFPFYKKYKARMTKKERSTFAVYCEKLLKMIDIYLKSSPGYSHRKDVMNAKKDLEVIIADVANTK